MLEMQRITSFDAGDNIVPYIDNRGNFKIYNGQNVDQISIQEVNYKHSDYLVAWKIGSAIFSYDNGIKKMLTAFGGEFNVKDSLIVFQDTRFKTVNVLYKGEIIQLMQQKHTEAFYLNHLKSLKFGFQIMELMPSTQHRL